MWIELVQNNEAENVILVKIEDIISVSSYNEGYDEKSYTVIAKGLNPIRGVKEPKYSELYALLNSK